MFRQAHQIDAEATQRAVTAGLDKWSASQDSWHDGSPDSIDRRLVQCDRLLAMCRGAVGRLGFGDGGHYMQAILDLEADRESLASLRHDLVTGCADREDVPSSPLGQRIASNTHTAAGPLAGDPVDKIMRWEAGEMDPQEEAEFFQHLHDTGLAYQLQGAYGRHAQDLLNAGVIHEGGVTYGPRPQAPTSPYSQQTFDPVVNHTYFQDDDRGMGTVHKVNQPGYDSEADFRNRTDQARDYARSTVGDDDVPAGIYWSSRMRRATAIEAAAFMSEQSDCRDRSELAERARRHAQYWTSTWPVTQSNMFTAAFVDRVGEMASDRPEPRLAAAPTTIPDFEDSLMYD